MMSISALPPELVCETFKYMGQQDLVSASLVCRRWLEPSRRLYWSRLQITIRDRVPKSLVRVLLDKNTSIPRQLGKISISEFILACPRSIEEEAAWQQDLATVIDYFTSISTVVIWNLRLARFPAPLRARILRPGRATSRLSIKNLVASSPNELMPFIFQNPSLQSLSLGYIGYHWNLSRQIGAGTGTLTSWTGHVDLDNLTMLSIDGCREGLCLVLASVLLRLPALDRLASLEIIRCRWSFVADMIKRVAPSLQLLTLDFVWNRKYIADHCDMILIWLMVPADNTALDLSQIGPLCRVALDLRSYVPFDPELFRVANSVSSLKYREELRILCLHPRLWRLADGPLRECLGVKRVEYLRRGRP